MKIVWLKPRSGYVTDLRSITLWGTICWGIRYLFGNDELNEFVKRSEAGNPDFVIGSAFPYKKRKGEPLLFFPNPLRFAPRMDDNDDIKSALVKYRLRKKLQDIKFLSQADFVEMLHGRFDEQKLLERLEQEQADREEYREKKKRGWKGEFEPSEIFVAAEAPRRHDNSMTHNTIDRLRGGTLSIPDEEGNQSGQLFHANDIWWSDPHDETENNEPKTGLFFLVEELAEGSIEKLLEPVLRLLEHWGIGADRTAGKGFFKFKIEDFTLEQPAADQSNALLNLSLLHPTESELSNFEETTYFFPYSLENREGKGWSEMGAFLKNPRLFYAEGSIFPRPDGFSKTWLGCLRENITDQNLGHRVLDNGLGLMLNLNWKGK